LPSSNQIVHVIDDDAGVRQSLAFLLSTAGLAVRIYESAVAFLKVLESVQDGCIVTDVRMPGMDGIELQRRLKAANNTMPVVVITGHGDIALAVEAMKAGALDFIEKPFDEEVLLGAIKSALTRRSSERQQTAAAEEIRVRIKALTERERQVLDGLVAGNPNKVIAHDLGISARTVEIYRANVMTKMQADSLSNLVRMSLLAGAQG
jgi:two-component system, LuxR family, response regulator FixJ